MIKLPPLPFANDALEPYISSKTLEFHYGKHHNAYVTNLNKLIEGTDLANKPLEDIIKETAGDAEKVGIFNNSAQVFNHNFYWNSITQDGGKQPKGLLFGDMVRDFGSYEEFKQAFKTAGATQFGSGWVWLVANGNKLEIIKTSNADTPITQGKIPLITMDVWEHAYYLDYQNRRPDYIDAFLDNLVDWDLAEEKYENAKKEFKQTVGL